MALEQRRRAAPKDDAPSASHGAAWLEHADEQHDEQDEDDQADDSDAGARRGYGKCGSNSRHGANTLPEGGVQFQAGL